MVTCQMEGVAAESGGGELAADVAMKNDPGTKDAADPIERHSIDCGAGGFAFSTA
jgi:hypothetical protein